MYWYLTGFIQSVDLVLVDVRLGRAEALLGGLALVGDEQRRVAVVAAVDLVGATGAGLR